MDTSSNNVIVNLENKVDIFDRAVVIAILFSVIFSALLLIYRAKLNSEQKKQIAELELGVSTANKTAEEARLQTEREHIKRLELQKAIAPREIDIESLARDLKPFSGFTVIIDELAELETSLLAQKLRDALAKAGCVSKEGIIMTSTRSPDWIGTKVIGNFNGLMPDALLAQFGIIIHNHFLAHGIQTQILNLSDESLPPKTIKIQLGLKPPIKM